MLLLPNGWSQGNTSGQWLQWCTFKQLGGSGCEWRGQRNEPDLPPWKAASCSHTAPLLVCLAVVCWVYMLQVTKIGPVAFVMARHRLLWVSQAYRRKSFYWMAKCWTIASLPIDLKTRKPVYYMDNLNNTQNLLSKAFIFLLSSADSLR